LKPYVLRSEFINCISSTDAGEDDDCHDASYLIKPVDSIDKSMLLSAKLSHLSEMQQTEFKDMLTQYESVITDVPGCTDVVYHKIELLPNARVIKLPPYRMSPSMQDQLKAELDILLAGDIIEESQSEWSSPCIVVPKPDGGIRAVVDFRQVNTQIMGNSFPLPLIEDLISRIGKAQIFTKFDLNKGFYQIKLNDNSKQYTAFNTPFGLFNFKRLPFGLKTSPSQFQYLMSKVLNGLQQFCGVFIDDIIVYSNTWAEHVRHVHTVLFRLLQAKLTVKLAKCVFACQEIDYLGHKIGHGCITPREAKVKALLDMSRPKDKKRLKSFLGAVGYFQRYIPQFSAVTAPLTALLKKDVRFEWSKETEDSFVRLKQVMADTHILVIADFQKPFTIFIDASDLAIGAVLTQCDEEGIYRPVCYMSRKLSISQRNYSVVEKELLALVLAIRSFSSYLSSETVVFTDHEPLLYMHKLTPRNSKLLRWSLELSPYNLHIKHIQGSKNCFADFLSRPNILQAV
jgi:hypothetical protein